jgi:hypothetical protein
MYTVKDLAAIWGVSIPTAYYRVKKFGMEPSSVTKKGRHVTRMYDKLPAFAECYDSDSQDSRDSYDSQSSQDYHDFIICKENATKFDADLTWQKKAVQLGKARMKADCFMLDRESNVWICFCLQEALESAVPAALSKCVDREEFEAALIKYKEVLEEYKKCVEDMGWNTPELLRIHFNSMKRDKRINYYEYNPIDIHSAERAIEDMQGRMDLWYSGADARAKKEAERQAALEKQHQEEEDRLNRAAARNNMTREEYDEYMVEQGKIGWRLLHGEY